MDGGEVLIDAMLEAVKTLGTRLTLRLDEVERTGPGWKATSTILFYGSRPSRRSSC